MLLAAVLLLRRPVAQAFGPRAAYALWALPMARLLLPPLVLPVWMAPAAGAAGAAAAPFAAIPAVAPVAAAADGVAALDAGSPAGSGLTWAGVLAAVWLAGAAIFLVRRYALYFRMRRELLAGARPMGQAGRVRLVETPGADGPVAFGVIDKVIALPIGFMGWQDRAARDLALAHELAHHRGHDLVCNMLVQPLFALHWFNPLSQLGWRALRRDQEAACDARVMARAGRECRAAYAAVIARFATQPRNAVARLALAAPMACPVLGDRSIVQRLRSLSMRELSARRQWSGRLAIAAAALALPMTGSISYARSEPTARPAPPLAHTPQPPPAAARPSSRAAAMHDNSQERAPRAERRSSQSSASSQRLTRRIIVRPDSRLSAQDRAAIERNHADHARAIAERDRATDWGQDQAEERRDMETHARAMAEHRREMARVSGTIDRQVRAAVREAQAETAAAVRVVALAPRVQLGCFNGQTAVTETVTGPGGRQRISICRSIATAEVLRAAATARAELHRAKGYRVQTVRSAHQADHTEHAD